GRAATARLRGCRRDAALGGGRGSPFRARRRGGEGAAAPTGADRGARRRQRGVCAGAAVSGHIVVDYEELRRMARAWADAAGSLAGQALSVASLAAESCIATNAVFYPMGAARAEMSILA